MLTRKSSLRLMLLCIAAAIFLSFVSLPGCIYVNAETSEPFEFTRDISLRGDLEKRQYDATNFSGVDVGAQFELTIDPGEQFSISIAAEEKIHEFIRAEVKNNVLDLGYSKSMRNPGDVVVHIVMPTLEYLSVSGAAEVAVSRGFDVATLRLDASGAAEIAIDIDAEDIVADLSGASEIDIAGRANRLKLDGSGSIEFNAHDLIVADANVDLSGASEASVNVSNDLKLDLSGASDLRCKQRPASINIQTSGMSDIDC